MAELRLSHGIAGRVPAAALQQPHTCKSHKHLDCEFTCGCDERLHSLKRCPSFTWCFLLLPRLHPGHPLVSAAALNRKACSEKRVTVIRRRPSNGLLGVASAFPAPRANRTERYLCTRLEFTGAAADTIISSTSGSIGPAKVSNNQSSRGTQQEKSSRGRILIAAVVEFGGRLWKKSPWARARALCAVYINMPWGKVCGGGGGAAAAQGDGVSRCCPFFITWNSKRTGRITPLVLFPSPWPRIKKRKRGRGRP